MPCGNGPLSWLSSLTRGRGVSAGSVAVPTAKTSSLVHFGPASAREAPWSSAFFLTESSSTLSIP
jgi:hypothetical protein